MILYKPFVYIYIMYRDLEPAGVADVLVVIDNFVRAVLTRKWSRSG
jgi:hypothetical protein